MKGLGCKNVMVVTDPGVVKAGIGDKVKTSLETAGLKAVVFDQVVADPPASLVLQACAYAAKEGVDGVLGVGGGSPMDVAKLVAFLNGDTTQCLDDIYGVDMCSGNRLPLIQVPTTAGTGSEVTPISILVTGHQEKKGVVSPALFPDWAVLDGELTLSVPSHVTAATGIDAMVHALEAYTSKLKKNPLSDLLGREALRLLSSNIRIAVQQGDNAHARGNMLLGSTYAGMAFANAPVGGVHALAYPVGSHFHVPHGLSNSLVLPHVLRFNGSDSQAQQWYSQIVGDIFPDSAPTPEGAAEVLASGFFKLAQELGIPTQLQDVQIKNTDVALLATEAMKQQRLLPNNPRHITHADAVAIYEAAL